MAPTWEIATATYNTLIKLVADIARRNNLLPLKLPIQNAEGKWVETEGTNLTWHSMYAATACPGPDLLRLMSSIASEANRINEELKRATYIRKHNSNYYLAKGEQVLEGYLLELTDKYNGDPYPFNETLINGEKVFVSAIDGVSKLKLDSNDKIIISNNESLTDVKPISISSSLFNLAVQKSNLSRSLIATYLYFGLQGSSLDMIEKDCFSTSGIEDVITEFRPSIIPDSFKNKYFKLKNIMGYLTLNEANNSILFTAENHSANQAWKIKQTSFGSCLVSRYDESKALAINSKNNAITFADLSSLGAAQDLESLKYSILTIVNATGDKYTLQSVYFDKYLGTTAVSYSPFWTSNNDAYSEFQFEETNCIIINDWLRLYFEPQNRPNSRVVEIPDHGYKDMNSNELIKEYSITGYEDVIFKHTEKSEWFAFEDTVELANNSGLNAAKTNYGYRVDTINGKQYAVADNPEYKGYYWIAVGPNVVQETFPLVGRIPGYADPEYPMYNQGTLDAVLSKNKNKYYVRCVIGDIKAHTWNNGIVQTDISYALKSGTSDYSNVNNHIQDVRNAEWHRENKKPIRDTRSCIEFISQSSGESLNQFDIEEIIFYDNPIL